MRRAIVFEDRVYVLGGDDGTSTLRSVECFTPGPPGREPTWHQVGWDSSIFFCCKSTYHNDVDTSNNVRSGHWQYKVNFEVKRKPPANYALVIQYFTM